MTIIYVGRGIPKYGFWSGRYIVIEVTIPVSYLLYVEVSNNS